MSESDEEESIVSKEPIYRGTHENWCDRVVRTRWSGIACDCGADWFCY